MYSKWNAYQEQRHMGDVKEEMETGLEYWVFHKV